MKIITYKLIIYVLLFISTSNLYAQTFNDKQINNTLNDSTYQKILTQGYDKISCYFSYPQGSSVIYNDYGRNSEEIKSLDEFVKSRLSDPKIYVNKIILNGYSSIEGDYYVNERLSKSRVNEFKKFLNLRYGFSYKYPIIVNWYGEDWAKLKEMVKISPLFEKEEVLNVIERVGIFDGRERILMNLNNGLTYKTLLEDFFPMLRRCEITIEYNLKKIIEEKYNRILTDQEFQEILKKEKEKAYMEGQNSVMNNATQKDSVINKQTESLSEKEDIERNIIKKESKNKKYKPIIGIKTNLASWAGICSWPEVDRVNTFLPNITAEVFIGKLFSIQGTAEYANWKYDGGKQFFGLTAYSIEPRIWLCGNKQHNWIYCGIFGLSGDFNLQSTKKKRIKENKQNCTGTYWGTGLSAGVYIPFTRSFGLEIGAKGGYMNGDAKEYDIEDGLFYYNHSLTKKGFGLSEINFSISYRFNIKNRIYEKK